MKIVIPGGAGQVGTVLARAFHADGHDVVVLSRRPGFSSRPWRVVGWDGSTLGTWAEHLEGCDAVINLAGRSVNCRYTKANRRSIRESRLQSTRILGRAIERAALPPRAWLQASTATIYAHRYDAPNDEATGILGGGEASAPDAWRFSIEVARGWEAAFDEAAAPYTRKLALRSAMTMSPDSGGVFDALLGLVRRGLGGQAGDGRQYVSWIHHRDFVAAVRFLLAHDDLQGVVNVSAPEPLPNAEFMRALRQAWGARAGLPVSRWMLEAGAFVIRTETELLLKSRRVVPARLLDQGFAFEFTKWADAARDLCLAWRRQGQGLPISIAQRRLRLPE